MNVAVKNCFTTNRKNKSLLGLDAYNTERGFVAANLETPIFNFSLLEKLTQNCILLFVKCFFHDIFWKKSKTDFLAEK